MRNPSPFIVWLAACAAAAVPMFAAAYNVHLDCAHFQRQSDGSWRGDASATLDVNGSQIRLANSMQPPESMLIDGVSLAARLERQCRPPAGKHAAPPSPDSGASNAGALAPAPR